MSPLFDLEFPRFGSALSPPIKSAVHSTQFVFRNSLDLIMSMTTEYCFNISQPISIWNGKPLATKNVIGIVSLFLVNSNLTCLRTVLFWRPVAPMSIMLLIGNVSIGVLPSSYILFSSIPLINDTLAPVSIIIFVHTPLIPAVMYIISLLFLLECSPSSSNNSSLKFFK